MDRISYATDVTVESFETLEIVETLATVESLETSDTSFKNVDNQTPNNDMNLSKSINSIYNDFIVKIQVNEDEKRQKRSGYNRKYYEKRKGVNEDGKRQGKREYNCKSYEKRKVLNEDEERRKKGEYNRKYYEKRKILNEKVIVGRNGLTDTQVKSRRNRKSVSYTHLTLPTIYSV